MWNMFTKKDKEKKTKTVAVTRTQIVKETTSTTNVSSVVRNFEQRSSVALSSNFNLHLNGNSLLLPNTGRPRSSSTNSRPNIDAKPFVPTNINLNYQSPYRNSPVYSSFNVPKSATTVKKPVPSLEQSIPNSIAANKKVVVKTTGKIYDEHSIVPTYATHSKNRGEALIINNIMFKDKGYRQGAKEDDKKLKELLKKMGFKVSVERDLKKSAMELAVKSFSKKSSLFAADIALVVVMSHGTRNEVLGGTEVFGIDEAGILVDNLLDYFTESNCKAMAKKPKIFIFQCCRGDNEQFVQSDATRIPTKVSVLADALIAYSTLPGFVSHRDPQKGTWYIGTLCEVFGMHAHEYHVEDLLKMVDMQLGSFAKSVRQTTHYENRGFKRCYLHPK